jgi:hypothetical protein
MNKPPFTDVGTAIAAIEAYQGRAEEFLMPIADSLQDSMGIAMAVITDHILAKGWSPMGFEQHDCFRVYRYASSV